MKKLCAGFILAFIAFLVPVSPAKAAVQHGFSVKQYEAFHDVLHPLEHEALPKNDFRTIRAKSAQLVSRGNLSSDQACRAALAKTSARSSKPG